MITARISFCSFIAVFVFSLSIAQYEAIAQADDSIAIHWRTGADLTTTLQTQATVAWSNVPLKKALNNFASVNRICVVLDRRINPDQLLEYESRDTTLEVTVRGIASKMKLGISFFGPVVYLGPPDTAAKLRTVTASLIKEIEALPYEVRKPWAALHGTEWVELENPQEILAKILTEVKTVPATKETIPHDLWSAGTWPAMNSTDRLTLLLAQFDLTFRLRDQGRAIEFVKFPSDASYTKEYRWPNIADLEAKLKKLGLTGEYKIAGNKLTFKSTAEEHQLVADLVSGKQARKTEVTEGEKRYTLSVKLPVRDLAKGLAPKLGVEFKFDETAIDAAKISLDQKVDLQVKDVTFSQLLDAIFKPAGLKYEKQGGNVYLIQPLKK